MPEPRPLKVLSQKEVCARIGLHRQTIYDLERAGKFPQRINLTAHRIGWREDEIELWLSSRARGIGQGFANA